MKIRIWCLSHNVPVKGEPMFVEAEGAGQWELDTSEMYCDESLLATCNGNNWVTIV